MPDLDPPRQAARRPRTRVSQDAARLRRAAWSFTTRRVPRGAVSRILREAPAPEAGDLVLARIDAIGHHARLQLASGRRRNLFVGDEVVVTYGNRYAASQFEAVVPDTLGPCQLVAGGGVAAKARSWHARIAKGATQITPIGLLAGATGKPANLRDYALPSVNRLEAPVPATVAVVGTSMDSGKTQTAAFLVKGLTLAGLRVGFAKVTGTGAGNDTWLVTDAGADPVLDFTDAGLVSTYLAAHSEIERVLITLVSHLTKAGVDAIVLEIADGVLQRETAALLPSAVFRRVAGAVLLAACDSMGAVAGVHWLKSQQLPTIGLSGVLTSSPLQREEAATATGLPVFPRTDLARASTALKILGWAQEQKLTHGGVDVGPEVPSAEKTLGAAGEAGAAPRPSSRPRPGVPDLRPEHGRA